MDRDTVAVTRPSRPTGVRTAAGLVALASMVFLGCAPDRSRAPSGEAQAQVLFSETPPAWFDAYFTRLTVAPDGSSALFDGSRLVDLSGGTASPVGVIDAASAATYDDAGRLVVRGRHGDDRGWFRAGQSDAPPELLVGVTTSERPVWSSSGAHIAYVGWSGDSTVRIDATAPEAEVETYHLSRAIDAVAIPNFLLQGVE